MVVSTRVIAAVGLSVVGLAALVGPSLGQQQQPQDPAVRKTTTQEAAPKPAPAVIGCVDIGAIFKGYDKVKFNSEEFRAAVMAKKGELTKLQAEAEQEAKLMEKMTPGTADYKKHEDRITQLKAQHDASTQQYEREFTLREAEMLATLYKEIQSMVARVAAHKGMNYIVRVSNDPINGSNPNAAMMAIERAVVYADQRNDITNDVIRYMNHEYKAAGGTVPKPSANGNTPAAPVSAPAPPRN